MQKQNTDPVADKAAAELLTAVKALNASSHFEEVKRRIEAADKTVITPETEFELVRAFIGQYGFSADPQVQQAREGFKVMLAQYLESHGDDPYWLLLVGLLHAGSPGESGLALDFLDSALSRSTSGNPLFMDTPAITAVRNRAADLLSQPYRAGRDFAGATKNFWERFQERAGDYAQIIGRTGDVDPVLFQNIEDELNSSLGQVIIGAHARLECSRENGHTEVIVRLLPNESRSSLLSMQYFADQAPEVEGWRVILGRDPDPEADIAINGDILRAADVIAGIQDQSGAKTLKVYAESLAGALKEDPEYTCWAVEELCARTLGDALVAACVGDIEVLFAPPETETVPLSRLAARLVELDPDLAGRSLGATLHARRSYTAVPQPRFTGWRSDVHSGESATAELVEGYFNAEPFEFDLLLKSGVTAGSIIVPVRALKTMTAQRLVSRLEAAGASPEHTMAVTGVALGSLFVYVDFLAWSSCAIAAVRDVLAAEGLETALFLPMRHNANFTYLLGNPVVLKGLIS